MISSFVLFYNALKWFIPSLSIPMKEAAITTQLDDASALESVYQESNSKLIKCDYSKERDEYSFEQELP